MTKNENLRLCGGTFFTLLLEARKQLLGANEHSEHFWHSLYLRHTEMLWTICILLPRRTKALRDEDEALTGS